MRKIKLDKDQRAKAAELYEYMSDDDNILEDVAQDLIYNQDRANKAEAENKELLATIFKKEAVLRDVINICKQHIAEKGARII